MIYKLLSFFALIVATANADTLTLLSGEGQIVPVGTGQHGIPITFQLTNGATPVVGALITFANTNGQIALPITANSSITDGNGTVTVGFAPGLISGVAELYTMSASAAGSNVVIFHETAASFPPTNTSLTAPPAPALFPYTASSQVAGPPVSINVFGGGGLQYVSMGLRAIPVAGVAPPPGTVIEEVSCLVNGVLVSQVLTDAAGNATCIPVFSAPDAALNFKYNTGQFQVIIGGSLLYGPFPYNILSSPPSITGGPKGAVVVTGSPVSAEITASGGTLPLTFTLAGGSGPLPPGITLGSTGLFSGFPTVPGIYPFVVQVTDAVGKVTNSASLGLSFDVSGGSFLLTPAAFTPAVVGKPYSQTATLTGGVPFYNLSIGGTLPAGLGIVFGTGVTSGMFTISGTPTASGTFPLSIIGFDAINSVVQTLFTLVISPPLTVPGATLPPATLNTPYSFQLTPTNGVGPYTFTSAGLPAGLTLTTGGVLAGTPTIQGLDNFSVTVLDFYGETITTQLILPVSGGPLVIGTLQSVTPAVANAPYTLQLPAPTGGVPPYVYSLTGSAIPEVSLSSTGLLTATFTTVGSQSLPFTVRDAVGTTVASTLQIAVKTSTPLISAVANSASSILSAVAPGEIVSIYGSDLGPVTGLAGQVASGAFLNTESGVQVTFGTYDAPILFVSAGQINAIVPFEVLPGSTVPVVVTYNGIASEPLSTMVQTDAPGIFLIGTTQGAVLNSDYSVNSATNGAVVGSFVVIYATGSGPLVPVLSDGEIATEPSATSAADLAVTIGGVPAQVLYAGVAPGLVAGLLQVNVLVPTGVPSGPAIPVVMTVGSQSTANESVTIGIK